MVLEQVGWFSVFAGIFAALVYLAWRAQQQKRYRRRRWLVACAVAAGLWLLLVGGLTFSNPPQNAAFYACNAGFHGANNTPDSRDLAFLTKMANQSGDQSLALDVHRIGQDEQDSGPLQQDISSFARRCEILGYG